MTYPLPPDVTDRIQQWMARGQYKNHEEVLRAAMKALERQEQDLAAIRAGIADYEAGRYQPFEKFDREMRGRYGIEVDP